jgi:hypothetical protein
MSHKEFTTGTGERGHLNYGERKIIERKLREKASKAVR